MPNPSTPGKLKASQTTAGAVINEEQKDGLLGGDGEKAMISFLGCSDQAIAVANGVTTLALLEHLVERKILTRADVRAVIESGIKCLEPRTNVRTINEAVHLMRDRMLPLFTE
jgi:hypothetical protein